MPRYIDADKCLDTMLDEMAGTGYQSRAMDVIRLAPTEDVAEVKHGKWVKPTPVSQEYCNQCGLTPKMIFGILPNYCPHCGAIMDLK